MTHFMLWPLSTLTGYRNALRLDRAAATSNTTRAFCDGRIADIDAELERRTVLVQQARADVAAGAGHECDEWRDTPDRRCALCDAPRPDDE